MNILNSNLPKKWGEGAIFAFSGVDGKTSVKEAVVATFLDEKYGLLLHTPSRRLLRIIPPSEMTANPIAITGDVVWIDFETDRLTYTWASWHTIIGTLPEGTTMSLTDEDAQSPVMDSHPTLSQSVDSVWYLLRQGNRFSLSYGQNPKEAQQRAELGLEAPLNQVVSSRLRWFENVQLDPSTQYVELAHKCLSVMKVNTLAPEQTFGDYWSTPDRVPHQNLWLWDSVFHSFAMNHVDANLSWYFLKSVLDMQLENGMIPIQGAPAGDRAVTMTQPPLLAWGVWKNYLHTENKTYLTYALPRLEAYLQWNLTNRDQNQNGLLEWDIEEFEDCRSGESGMDNSPRFDNALTMDAVDFSTFQANDMLFLSQIASELGDTKKTSYWHSRYEAMCKRIDTLLWDDQRSLYFDRLPDGSLSDVAAVSGFLPMLLRDISAEHVSKLVDTLQNPAQFNTKFPIPTVSIDHPEWSTDMWRGATWINLNYMVIHGLRQHGYDEIANQIRDKSLYYVNKYYQTYGVIFEFFDSKDKTAPVDCSRKGARMYPYDIRQKIDSIRDFHWSAALTFDLLLELDADTA